MADPGGGPAEPLRWGILGPSSVARRFADELATSATGRLRAVASRRLEQARSFVGTDPEVQSYGSYAELLATDDVDAVYIATVPSSHADLAVGAAAAGKHALVEKPLTVTSAQAVAAVGAARAAGTGLAEAMLYRFHPQTELLLDLLHDGAIGEVHAIEASCGSMVEPWPGASRSNPALGGGAVVSVGCYPVSMARLVPSSDAGSVVLTTVARGRRTLQSAAARPYALAVDALAGAGHGGQVPQVSWDDSVGNARTLDDWRAAVGMRYPFEG